MIHLALIAAILLGSAAFAALQGRASRLDPPRGPVRRLRDACTTATLEFLSRTATRAAAPIVVGVAGAVAATVAAPGGGWPGAFWAVVAGALGLAAALLVARGAASAALHTAAAAAGGAPGGLAAALRRLLGGAVAITLLADLVATAGAWLAFGLPFAVQGGFSLEGAAAAALAVRCSAVVPVYGLVVLGLGCALQQGAGSLLSAARGAEAAPTTAADEGPRAPVLVTRLVALAAGGVVARAYEGLVLSTLFAMGTIGVGVQAWSAHPEVGAGALALPWITRALASVASGVGVAVVLPRGLAVLPALWRSEGAALVVCCAAIGGATTWLAGAAAPRLAAAAAVMVLGVAGTAHVALGIAGRRAVRREVTEWTRTGGPALAAGALVSSSALGVAALAACLGVAAAAAAVLSAPLGGMAGVLPVSAGALLGLAPWVLAVGLVGPLAELARTLQAGGSGSPSAELEAMHVAGGEATGWSRSVLLAALGLVTTGGLALLAAPALAAPGAVATGALAAITVAGAAVAHSVRTDGASTHALLREAQGQAARRLTGDASPGYRPALHAAVSAALSSGWQAPAWPLVVAAILVALARGVGGPGAVSPALLGLVATALCLCVVLGAAAALFTAAPGRPAGSRDAGRAAAAPPSLLSPLLAGGAVPGLVPVLGVCLAVALLALPLTL